MSVELIHTVSGPPEIRPIIAFHEASKWYGNVIGLNKLTLEISAGITGLLGPNGAGKSTLLQLATGQLCPSQGSVEVLGQRVWNNPELNRHIGLCPEQDALYEWMTGNDFVTTCARLAGMTRRKASEAAAKALEAVGMTERKNRVVRGYSKGMRQRTKLAQALVHDPQVLFLDEPMTGTDPVARRDLMDIVQRLAAEGKSVVVSSHVLHEIEALTPNFILLNHGRLLAQGHIRQIRDLMDQHPHRIVLVCGNSQGNQQDHGQGNGKDNSRDHAPDHTRSLAARLVQYPDVQGIRMQDQPATLTVETVQPDIFYARLPQLAMEGPWNIQEVYSEDDNLEAVFRYLVTK